MSIRSPRVILEFAADGTMAINTTSVTHQKVIEATDAARGGGVSVLGTVL